MIEREFIVQKTKEFYIKDYIERKLQRAGISMVKLRKIPLGEKIIIATSRPSLVVGSKGSNIKELTKVLKKRFALENPQIEIVEVKNVFLDAAIVADQIASTLERFGSNRFKGAGHRMMSNVMGAGALGVELILSGKIPGARAKNWRFYQGYLKKCGDVSVSGVRSAQASARLKSGTIGIKVAIMPPDLVLPDHIKILDEPIQVVEEVLEEPKKSKKRAGKKRAERKSASKKKKVTKKKVTKGKKEGEKEKGNLPLKEGAKRTEIVGDNLVVNKVTENKVVKALEKNNEPSGDSSLVEIKSENETSNVEEPKSQEEPKDQVTEASEQ